jgi:tetratricopeptide (TPR) repeat protein
MDIVYTMKMIWLTAPHILAHYRRVYFAKQLMLIPHFSLTKLSRVFLITLFSCGVSQAQGPAKTTPANPSPANPSQGVELAAKGRCREALPILKKSAAHLVDKQLKYRVEMSTARCAMSLDQTQTAVDALLILNREFPHDPDVLYSTTHFYSELASRAAQELAATAPTSHQAEQLEAEAFESQGNWDRAIAQYKKILEQEPGLHGIHYRIGRIYLSKSPIEVEKATPEFLEELKIDPTNASAEFMLGETDRQAGRWDEAIGHFSRAAKFDEGFQEAYLALGMSLNAAGKFAEAVAPLQNYIKMQPADPAGHYQLATAYSRTGHKAEADREMALQRDAAAKNPQAPR